MERARMTSSPPDAGSGKYHPVILFPEVPVVLDLSQTPPAPHDHRYTIGRYDEERSIYTQNLFAGKRTLHVGLDLGAPSGTPVHAFTDCTLYALGVNEAAKHRDDFRAVFPDRSFAFVEQIDRPTRNR